MAQKSSVASRRVVQYALLTALAVVLQLTGFAIPGTTIQISLALVPLVIGAILFGPLMGTYLGFVLGLINFIISLTANPFMLAMFDAAPVLFIITCFGKTMAAGAVAGLISRALKKKNGFLGTCLASVSVPIVNTGIFVLMMFTFFSGDITAYFGSETVGNVFSFIVLGMVGINFIVEFLINAVFCPAIDRVLKVVGRYTAA